MPNNRKTILPPPMNPQKEPVTVAILTGKLDALFENVKEFVKITVKGSETTLQKRIDGVEERLEKRIDGVEERLEKRIDGVEERLEKRIDGVEKTLRKELNEMEHRLGTRIDKVGERLDHHEQRITTLENVSTGAG